MSRSDAVSAAGVAPAEHTAPHRWRDLLQDGRALYLALVVLATIVHALQILVMAIIMPTVVADVGGAAYYTWPSMIYTVASIVGAASVGPVWSAFGRRGGLVAGAAVFLVGTIACALAPDMGWLVGARAVQGVAGGMIAGAVMALISGLFPPTLRTRVIALYQATWMAAQLSGPLVGGLFAELD
jgi:MFS family permease